MDAFSKPRRISWYFCAELSFDHALVRLNQTKDFMAPVLHTLMFPVSYCSPLSCSIYITSYCYSDVQNPLRTNTYFLLSGAAVASASSQLTYHPHWLVVRPPTFFDIHFTQPFFFGENRTFLHLKTQTSHFLPQNSDAGSFSTPSSSSQLRPCLWDQPVVSSTERHHPHETASNQSEPKCYEYLRLFSFFQTSFQLPAFLFAAALAALFGRAFALDSADSHCLHVEVREKVGCKSL